MKRRKWMLLTFHAVDYRSIPLFLERQEERGWRLERVLWPWIGLFVPAETQSRYAADLFPSDALGDEEKQAEYLRLCADAVGTMWGGWTGRPSSGPGLAGRWSPSRPTRPWKNGR